MTGRDAQLLLKTNLKLLRLPTMLAEFTKLAREAAESDQDYLEYLLRLTELELTTRASNALETRIKQANFPVHKDLDTFDFSASPGANKQKVLELARCQWVDEKKNCCLIGASGTGKTHVATALGLAACRLGKRVRFYTAATLVNQLEVSQKQYQLERFQKSLDRTDLLICDELGYLSFIARGRNCCFKYSPTVMSVRVYW